MNLTLLGEVRPVSFCSEDMVTAEYSHSYFGPIIMFSSEYDKFIIHQ